MSFHSPGSFIKERRLFVNLSNASSLERSVRLVAVHSLSDVLLSKKLSALGYQMLIIDESSLMSQRLANGDGEMIRREEGNELFSFIEKEPPT